VVLSGSGFTDATAVNFGPNAAQRFTFDSDAQITAVSPAGSGSVNITVTTPAGVSPQSQATQFTYS
jgi:trimeric autotransporter adhesin